MPRTNPPTWRRRHCQKLSENFSSQWCKGGRWSQIVAVWSFIFWQGTIATPTMAKRLITGAILRGTAEVWCFTTSYHLPPFITTNTFQHMVYHDIHANTKMMSSSIVHQFSADLSTSQLWGLNMMACHLGTGCNHWEPLGTTKNHWGLGPSPPSAVSALAGSAPNSTWRIDACYHGIVGHIN